MKKSYQKLIQKYKIHHAWREAKHRNAIRWGALIMSLGVIGLLITSLWRTNFYSGASFGFFTPKANHARGDVIDNSIIITEESGVAATNYPIQVGRPFLEGEIKDFPQAVINNQALPTQADVKNRWGDGSVKYAILSLLIPTLESHGAIRVSFQNQSSGGDVPLTQAQMLGDDFNFDARMELESGGKPKTASARAMLQNGDFTYWTKGQAATTLILADHASGKYDFGWRDKKYTTIAKDIGASATSVDVTYAADIAMLSLPTTIQVGAEQMIVSSVSGNTLTVIRGANNTTPSYRHATGTVVESLSQPSEIIEAPANQFKSFRPIFHATFWPAIQKVRVRYVGEISNTAAFQDQTYSLALTLGYLSPQDVYTKPTITHYAGSRWTKEFWIGGAPSKIKIDHNLPYLIATKFIPNFDTSKAIPEATIQSGYDSWLKSSKDLYDNGNLTKYMPTTGGRADIGPYPSWTVRWLYTSDSRAKEQAFGNADLAAAWPMHLREGNSEKFLDREKTVPGLGKILSVSSRPTIALWVGYDYQYTKLEDRVIAVGARNNGGWVPDGAHQPDTFSPQYTLSGDYWYLEEAQFWASFSAARYNGAGTTVSYGRGPTGAEGGIHDEVRGDGWVFRSRAQTAFLSPDDTPEKKYFTTLVNDAIAIWEGKRNIKGTSFEGNANWSWGNTIGAKGWEVLDGKQKKNLGPSPLHFWENNTNERILQDLDTEVTGGATSPWMQNYLIYSLGRAKELGFSTGPLLEWVGKNLIGQLTDPGFNHWLAGSYHMPVMKADKTYFETWSDVITGYPDDLETITTWPGSGYPKCADCYTFIAYAATAMITNQPGGIEARSKLEEMIGDNISVLNTNPQFAILPRAETLITYKESDLNKDTKTNQQDFDILKQNFNRTDKPSSDLNQDGIVDARDLGILMSEWTR